MNGSRVSSQPQKIAQSVNLLSGTRKGSGKLTQNLLKDLLDYNPETGVLIWLSGARKGQVAGCYKGAYATIRVRGQTHKLHRIIWLWVYGEMPDTDIDHESRNKHDNRLCNLRKLTHSQNLRNRTIGKQTTTGVLGVCRLKKSGKFKSQIVCNDGKNRTLYTGYDLTEAAAFRLAAEQCLGFDTYNNSSPALLHVTDHIQKRRARQI